MSGNNLHNPLVSIIIPCWNREKLVGETLHSIIAQSYKNWECIVVDDHSYDDSIKVVKDYSRIDSRIKCHIRPYTYLKGANVCRNYGFEISNGEFINWFDSDDLMSPNMIEEKVKLIQMNKYDYVICRCGDLDYKKAAKKLPEYQLYSKNLLEDFLSYKVRFYTPGPLFRKSFLNTLDRLFDEELHRHQETEFYTRVILRSKNYAYIEETLIFLRDHCGSIKQMYDQLSLDKKDKYDLIAVKKKLSVLRKHSSINRKIQKYHYEFFKKMIWENIRLRNIKINILFESILLILNYKLYDDLSEFLRTLTGMLAKKIAVKIGLIQN